MIAGPSPSKSPIWVRVALGIILLLDVWLRCHTIGPTIRSAVGFAPYPVAIGEAEPLDCDEALYAYMGKAIGRGEALYRDLTENKPPLGYWIYALGVAIGGASETTVRLLPIPMVLVTLILIWRIGLRLGGPIAAVAAALSYAIASTDPYLYANGAHLEHAINLFAAASLDCLLSSRDRRVLFLAGAFLALASLVRQVAVVSLPIAALYLWLDEPEDRRFRSKNVASLILGFGATWAVCVAILVAQGSGPAAFEDIVRYGGALASQTPPEPNAPPFLLRWVVGNSDPRNGALPPPFGKTDWLVWWGSGTWPLWLAAVPALGRLWIPGKGADSGHGRRLVVAWTLSALVQVALPRLFWAHYYLMAMPGIAIAVGVALGDAAAGRGWLRWPTIVVLAASIAATAAIQVRDYLLVPAELLAPKYKGGGQWLMLRSLGRDVASRTRDWGRPRLLLWGWQSPLYVYGNLDAASRQTFGDPLIKAFGREGTNPLIRPRLDRILADVRARPPEIVMAGDPPFPALRSFLVERYYRTRTFGPTPDGSGLWVRKDRFEAYEAGR